MAKTYALTTETRLKALLKITGSDFDTILKDYAYKATDIIERACGGRRFQQTTYTQELYDGSYIDGTKRSRLVLRNAPLVTLSALEYATGASSSPTWVAFQADDYVLDKPNGIIQVALPRGLANVRVTHVSGYLIDFANMYDETKHTLPFDLTDLAERIAIRLFKKRESEGRSVEAFQQSSITWDAKLIKEDDQATIENHRRPFLF